MTDLHPAASVPECPTVTPARRRTAHPLLGAFPLTVMTIATFAVLFALLMARLTAGLDPGLLAQATPVVRTSGSAGEAVRTRVSGSSGPVSRQAVAGAPAASGASPIATRPSGATGTGRVSDE